MPDVTLGPLASSATYYWRVRADATGAIGATSNTSSFRIGVVLLAPVPVSPANGVLIGDLKQPVTLAVQNPTMPSTITAITDTFEVATDMAFAIIVASKSLPQTAGAQTSVTLNALPPSATYYWRVRTAATSAIGATSTTASFRIGPSVMAGPYQLAIDGSPAAYCGAYKFPHRYVFGGNLIAITQGWVFGLPPDPQYYGPNDLTLRMMLSGSRVTGSLVSSGSQTTNQLGGGGPPWEITVSQSSGGRPARPVDISGLVNADGSITGVFGGYLGVGEVSFGDLGFCLATFPWWLVPR